MYSVPFPATKGIFPAVTCPVVSVPNQIMMLGKCILRGISCSGARSSHAQTYAGMKFNSIFWFPHN